MNFKTILTVAVFVLFSGCVNRAVKTKNDPNCRTTLVGKLHVPLYWTGEKPPVLVRKHDYQYTTYYGQIIEINENEVIFDQNRESLLFNPEPTSFPIEEVACLIDSSGKVLLGSIPRTYYTPWEFEIGVVPVENEKRKPLWIRFDANQPFSYCLPPAKYKIKSFIFFKGPQVYDYSYGRPSTTFVVEPNKTNYLGDLFLDVPLEKAYTITVKCHKGRRPYDDAVKTILGDGAAIINDISKLRSRLTHSIAVTDSSSNSVYMNQDIIRSYMVVDTVTAKKDTLESD